MKNKRSISLIEVLIALTLLSFLIGALFFWYHSFFRQKEEFEQIKWPLIEERYALERLERMIPKAELPFFSIEEDQSLVFLFNRGPWKDPKLSDRVLARIYHNPQNECLCLGIWPDPSKYADSQESPSQTLVLLDNVSSVAWKFYFPPDPFKKTVAPEEVGNPLPREGWQDQWMSDWKKLPALVELKINRIACPGFKNERRVEYFFDLSAPIIFNQQKVAL